MVKLKGQLLKEATICQLILLLYETAAMSKDIGHMYILQLMFIMAKKMNRKLYLNKYGKLPTVEGNSWEEEDWIAELDKIYRVREEDLGKEGV